VESGFGWDVNSMLYSTSRVVQEHHEASKDPDARPGAN